MIPAPPWWIIPALLMLIIAFRFSPARGQTTPDDWFKLVTAIQQQEERLDKEDRYFVRYMVNILALDQAATPTPVQRRWLIDIKNRLHIIFVPEERR